MRASPDDRIFPIPTEESISENFVFYGLIGLRDAGETIYFSADFDLVAEIKYLFRRQECDLEFRTLIVRYREICRSILCRKREFTVEGLYRNSKFSGKRPEIIGCESFAGNVVSFGIFEGYCILLPGRKGKESVVAIQAIPLKYTVCPGRYILRSVIICNFC